MPAVREAKARLSDMNVQEVSLVDRAANERVFAITKRDGQMKMTKAEWAAKAKALKGALTATMAKLLGDRAAGLAKLDFKLPSEAKQSLMDALADSLDKLTALATMVGDAEVDDAAPVPEELAAALTQVAEALETAAAQYAPAGAEETAEQTPGDQQQAGGTGPAGAPPPGADAPEKAAKGLPPELHDGDALKAEMHDGDSLKELLQKAVGAGYITAANLSKAGRKIAGKRYDQLKSLHDTLGKLLNELAYDEASEKAGDPPPPEKGKKPGEAPAKKSADAELAEADLRKSLDAASAARAALEKRMDEHEARLNEIGKRAGAPASAPVEGGPPPAAEGEVQWPLDMSAAVVAKRKQAPAGRKF